MVAEAVDLRRMIEEVAHDARLMMRGKPVTVDAACDVVTVLSDPLRLRQILNNLVTNAARATQSGRIALAARRDGDRLVLVVSDTGCGIAPEKHAAIFDAFEQIGGAPGSGGIGLGLAIVRQLVEVLDGEVRVESALGAGATFTVRLPLLDDAARAITVADGAARADRIDDAARDAGEPRAAAHATDPARDDGAQRPDRLAGGCDSAL